MKKVLIISPIPTHPANAGNRLHIKLLSEFLRRNNFDVYFFYMAFENFQRDEMSSFWGENLHIIERKKIFQKRNIVLFIIKKGFSWLKKKRRWAQKILGQINSNQYKFNTEADNYFPTEFGKQIQQFHKIHRFNIVICEYAVYSKALTYFDKSVLKIIDAHDKFTDRFNMYIKNNVKPEWISLYKSQEKKALRRADLIIALQYSEKKYFEDLSKKPCVIFFSIPEVQILPIKGFEEKILYFGSANKINVKTIEYFENQIFPLVLEKHPGAQLLIGGTICNLFKPGNRNVHLLGIFDSPEDFYKLGDIVINPEIEGTGLKVKTIEALCFGMPVVSTTGGAVGAHEPFINHILIADTPLSFARCLNELLENASLRESTSENARKWINFNKERLSDNLLDFLLKD